MQSFEFLNILTTSESESPVEISGIFPSSFNFIIAFGTLLIVVIVLVKFLWKPVIQYIENRQNFIAGKLKSASEKEQESIDQLDKTKEKLANVSVESELMLQNAKNRADQFEKIEKEKLAKELFLERERNKERMDLELAKMQKEMNTKVISHSVQIAKTYLGDANVDDIESSIAKLTKAGE